MIDRMLMTIEQNQLIEKGDKIVLGLSGGADSLSLAHALLTLKDRLGIEIVAVHINHMLRGAVAAADAEFVRGFCVEHQVPVEIFEIDVAKVANDQGLSFEEAGRNVRYEKFNDVLKATHAQKIAVAQNRNDVIETFLMHLIRGSGIDGLASIDYMRDATIIRPLLDIERSAIDQYCRDNGLEPRHDHTNDENAYMRNKVRNCLLPDLRNQFNPSIDEAIHRTVNMMKSEKDFWRYHNEKLFSECCKYENEMVFIGTTQFDALHLTEKSQLIRYAIKMMKGNLTNLSYERILQTVGLTRTGSMCEIDEKLSIRRSHHHFILFWNDKVSEVPEKVLHTKSIPIGRLEDYTLPQACACLDADKVIGKVHARSRLPGDTFIPYGMSGHKKIKSFFIDEKIPFIERDKTMIVCDDEKIIWVENRRISELCKITEETKNVMIISFQELVESK